MKVAVLGTYRSGSSAIAGILHHLGVDMGEPFFGDYYEPADLSEKLRKWWDEPNLVENSSPLCRYATLLEYINKRKPLGGAKHPLLVLSAQDIIKAWPPTKFIWAYRPAAESIESLKKLQWWPGREEYIQNKLFWRCTEFFRRMPGLIIPHRLILAQPATEVQRIVEWLGLEVTDKQFQKAVESILLKRAPQA